MTEKGYEKKNAGTIFYDVALGDTSKVIAAAKALRAELDRILNVRMSDPDDVNSD